LGVPLLFMEEFEVVIMIANATEVGSEEAHPVIWVLASVRRSNCTYSFPVCSFHEDSKVLRCKRRN
jgi:hypothetical protein